MGFQFLCHCTTMVRLLLESINLVTVSFCLKFKGNMDLIYFLVFPPNLLDLACQTFQWGRQKQPTHEAAPSFALKLLGTK